jgi:hypothetical protein
VAGINSWLKPVTGRLKELASDIVTVRTGTVISDNAAMTQTVVTLDNDPDSAQVQALCLNGPLPEQTRVMLLAYPPRGLVVVGTLNTDVVTANTAAAIAASNALIFPLGTGAWTDWTPTVTQSGAVTRNILRAKYTKIGRIVHIMGNVSITGPGTAANQVVIGGLPVLASTSGFQRIGVAGLFDSSANDDFTGILRFANTNNTLNMLSTRANGTLGSTSFTAALAGGDAIEFSGTYESAT